MHSNQSQALATSSHASQWPVSPTCQMRKLSPAQTAPLPGSLLRTHLPHPSHLLGPRRAGPCTHSHPPRPTLGAARHRSLRQEDTFPLLQRISETLITDRAQDARKEWLRQPRPWMAPAQLPPAALSPKCPCARHPPVLTALLTKPLPMTRQSPLRESQSLLVKWNCASWELRNRGPRVVWGQQGDSWVTAGVGCSEEHTGGLGEGLTSSCCGISCMISFCGHWSVSLQEERVRGAPAPSRPPTRPPGTHRFSPWFT